MQMGLRAVILVGHLLLVLWGFLTAHWLIELFVLLLCVVYAIVVSMFGPGDFTGNGIVVGPPKNFDNRSLTMMIEQLDAALKGVNAVDAGVTKQLGTLQQQDTTSSTAGLTFGTPGAAEKAAGDDKKPAEKKTGTADATAPAATVAAAAPKQGSAPANLPAFGFAAPDALMDQLDLSYQIFNLRILNERSLTDRLYPGGTRMQVVLGFQISIDPPRGSEDCAAIVEIGLQLDGSYEPVSIVAMIPQEKTYNAASLSSEGRSINGSLVSKVTNLGAKFGRQQDHFYLHRDADTIAFERNTLQEAAAFGVRTPRASWLPTVLGWEFRPVLGRRTVTPGARQMLAVIALPCTDNQTRKLIVQSRAFWRNYNRKRQTSSVRWWGWPLAGRLGGVPNWRSASLTIDPPVMTESQLGPKIKRISWVNAGSGMAVVLIEGRNFFTNTEVTIGGRRHYNEETNLTIKSDSALEVRTTIAALNEGEAVLSGRFGPTIPLVVNADKLPATGINMENASFGFETDDAFIRVSVVIVSSGPVAGKAISRRDFEKLPDSILYVNGQPIFGAYDYTDCYSQQVAATTEAAAKAAAAAGAPAPVAPATDAVTIQAWAPATYFKGTGSVVGFKVPFCGEDWVASSVVRLPEKPSLTVLHIGSADTAFLITVPPTFEKPRWSVELDIEYTAGHSQLAEIDRQHLRFVIANNVLAGYTQLILRNQGGKVFFVDLPQSATPQVPHLDTTQTTPTVPLNRSGVCVWEGAQLGMVTGATIDSVATTYTVYDGGRRVSVFIAVERATAGMHTVSLAFPGGALAAAFFAVDDPAH